MSLVENFTNTKSNSVLSVLNKKRSMLQSNLNQVSESFDESSIASEIAYKLRDSVAQIDLNFGNAIQLLENNESISSNFKKNKRWDPKSSRQQIINRADSSVRQLSAENRIRSCEKIKTEEICFRFKLKMMALLRVFSFKLEDIQKLKELQPEDFIFNFSSKLKAHFKNMQSQYSKLKQKCQAIGQTLKVKNEQLNEVKWKLSEKQKQIHSINLKSMTQYKEHKSQIQMKQKQIDSLNLTMYELKTKISKANKSRQKQKQFNQQKKQNQNADNNIKQIESLTQAFQSKKNECLAYQNRIFQLQRTIQQQKNIISSLLQQNKKEIKNKQITKKSIQSQTTGQSISLSMKENNVGGKENQQILTQKMSQIIQQWKNHMYSTVDDYERILQSCNEAIYKKDEQIKCLKVIAKKYFQNKLN